MHTMLLDCIGFPSLLHGLLVITVHKQQQSVWTKSTDQLRTILPHRASSRETGPKLQTGSHSKVFVQCVVHGKCLCHESFCPWQPTASLLQCLNVGSMNLTTCSIITVIRVRATMYHCWTLPTIIVFSNQIRWSDGKWLCMSKHLSFVRNMVVSGLDSISIEVQSNRKLPPNKNE